MEFLIMIIVIWFFYYYLKRKEFDDAQLDETLEIVFNEKKIEERKYKTFGLELPFSKQFQKWKNKYNKEE